jgi:hypothetical protein
LTLAIYQITAMFPAGRIVWADQSTATMHFLDPGEPRRDMRRNGDAEFARFCSIAMGSASELEYHLLLAKDLKLIQPKDQAELSQRATELKRMLTALLQELNADRWQLKGADLKISSILGYL